VSLDRLIALARLLERCATDLEGPVVQYCARVEETLKAGGTLFFAGNGGSAAHAQHIATEYVVRYQPVARHAARAIALSTDTSLITAAGNDLGFDRIFARQIEAHGRAGDLLIAISGVVGLLGGDGGKLRGMCDIAIVVPSGDTALVQEVHLAIDHHVCSVVEPTL
jgi:D-sedoheptulose 7-phosphate isomerase